MRYCTIQLDESKTNWLEIYIPNDMSTYQYFYYVYIWKQLYDEIDKALATTTVQSQTTAQGVVNTKGAKPPKGPINPTKDPTDTTKDPINPTKDPTDTTKDPTDTTKGPTDTTKDPTDTTKDPTDTKGTNPTKDPTDTKGAKPPDGNCAQNDSPLTIDINKYETSSVLIKSLISCYKSNKNYEINKMLQEIKENILKNIRISYRHSSLRIDSTREKFIISFKPQTSISKYAYILSVDKIVDTAEKTVTTITSDTNEYQILFDGSVYIIEKNKRKLIEKKTLSENRYRNTIRYNVIINDFINGIASIISKIGYYPTKDYENYRYKFQGGFEDSEKDFFGFFECLNYTGDNNTGDNNDLKLDGNFFVDYTNTKIINIEFNMSMSRDSQLKNNNFSQFKKKIIQKLIPEGIIEKIPTALAPAKVRYRHLYF